MSNDWDWWDDEDDLTKFGECVLIVSEIFIRYMYLDTHKKCFAQKWSSAFFVVVITIGTMRDEGQEQILSLIECCWTFFCAFTTQVH